MFKRIFFLLFIMNLVQPANAMIMDGLDFLAKQKQREQIAQWQAQQQIKNMSAHDAQPSMWNTLAACLSCCKSKKRLRNQAHQIKGKPLRKVKKEDTIQLVQNKLPKLSHKKQRALCVFLQEHSWKYYDALQAAQDKGNAQFVEWLKLLKK